VVKIGTAAVSWSSKLQTLVALSTIEAEHISAVTVEAGKEILWMCQLMGKLGCEMPGPSVLWMDNQSAIAVNKHPEHHGKMKHPSLCLFWLRDVVQEGLIAPHCTNICGYSKHGCRHLHKSFGQVSSAEVHWYAWWVGMRIGIGALH
jgi:hypothetical protein